MKCTDETTNLITQFFVFHQNELFSIINNVVISNVPLSSTVGRTMGAGDGKGSCLYAVI